MDKGKSGELHKQTFSRGEGKQKGKDGEGIAQG